MASIRMTLFCIIIETHLIRLGSCCCCSVPWLELPNAYALQIANTSAAAGPLTASSSLSYSTRIKLLGCHYDSRIAVLCKAPALPHRCLHLLVKCRVLVLLGTAV
jgi:hypothetical protein